MIPRSVIIAGVTYSVERVSRQTIGGDAGECRPMDTRILIAKELSPAAQRATYLHEVGHASMYESGAQEAVRHLTTNVEALEETLVQVWLPVYRLALGVK